MLKLIVAFLFWLFGDMGEGWGEKNDGDLK